jgi:hypothetical protein
MLTRIAMGSASLWRADEKLTAFMELQPRFDPSECPEDCGAREITLAKLSRIR